MSPEQLRSSKSVDARADLWAMGVILYELTTGNLPYMGESLGELFAAILENDAPSARQIAPHVPPVLDEIILKCLRKRPDERFQSSQELHDALAFALSGGGATVALAGGHGMAGVAPAMAVPPGMVATPGYGAAPGADRVIGSSPALPAAMASTPSTMGRPGISGMGSTTGSGANMPVVKGTVALGAQTPGVGQASGTYAPPQSPPKGKGGAVWGAAIGGVFLVLAVGGAFGFKVMKGGQGAATNASPALSATTVAAAPSISAPSSSASGVASVAAAPSDAPAATGSTASPVTPSVATPVSANGGRPKPSTPTALPGAMTRPAGSPKLVDPAPAPPPPVVPVPVAPPPTRPPSQSPEQGSR
jgi:serine/threonine-protein kinase